MRPEDVSNSTEITEIKIPELVPLLPAKNLVVYPQLLASLTLSTETEIKLIDHVLSKDKVLCLASLKKTVKHPAFKDLYPTACICYVLKLLRLPDNTVKVLVQGLRRAQIKDVRRSNPFLLGRMDLLEETAEKTDRIKALAHAVSENFQKLISQVQQLPEDLKIYVANLKDPSALADLVASNLDITLKEKIDLLETLNVRVRLKKVLALLQKKMQIVELGSKVQDKVSNKLSKSQHDFILREQIKAIQQELGEGDDKELEYKESLEKITAAGMSPQAKEAAVKEVNRLKRMPPGSAEETVSRTYLDWLINIPWSKSGKDKLNIKQAKTILERDHYDLEKVKKRILEYLAVRQLAPDKKGPILCFVGPPGVGKTSLGQSIASAIGRKFIRVSLGGMRDEAEIRGHRRTYIGALPGQIIQGLRRAETKNPVFMLDEVDKLGIDFHGDPAAALLEVLDPEQNSSFRDHYIDLPFDLSQVMFITTANQMEPVPPALRDRMEVLELIGYTEKEKIEIARRYLLPKLTKEHGLLKKKPTFDKQALAKVITAYTREAGVRQLERELAGFYRQIAQKIVEKKKFSLRIKEKDVPLYLGAERFFFETKDRLATPGVATGLAWTPTGGEILFIEATMMPGNKSLTLTGQLGNVMKESASAALSYVRANAKKLKIKEGFFQNTDLHIHVPAGAIPKDGPSAGITMATALISLLTNRKVRPDVALTGEITLRGRVLPVGGIKNKILAANRAGIKKIILPAKNRKDLSEIPATVKKQMKFTFVNEIKDVLRHAFLPK